MTKSDSTLRNCLAVATQTIHRCVVIATLTGVSAISPATLATPIADSATGLVSPDVLIDFGNALYPDGTVITNQFASQGITFDGAFTNYQTGENAPYWSGGYVQGVNGNNSPPPGNLLFANDITDVAFTYYSNLSNTTFAAYLDNVLVESFVAATSYFGEGANVYYGFTGILFDEVRVSISHANNFYRLDNLQFNLATALPLPATMPLVLAAFGALALAVRRRRKTL